MPSILLSGSCINVLQTTCYRHVVLGIDAIMRPRSASRWISYRCTYRNHAHRILCRLFAFRNCNPVRKIAINRQHLPSRIVNRVASRRVAAIPPTMMYYVSEWPCWIIDIVREKAIFCLEYPVTMMDVGLFAKRRTEKYENYDNSREI